MDRLFRRIASQVDEPTRRMMWEYQDRYDRVYSDNNKLRHENHNLWYDNNRLRREIQFLDVSLQRSYAELRDLHQQNNDMYWQREQTRYYEDQEQAYYSTEGRDDRTGQYERDDDCTTAPHNDGKTDEDFDSGSFKRQNKPDNESDSDLVE